jgi:hypothetical protein
MNNLQRNRRKTKNLKRNGSENEAKDLKRTETHAAKNESQFFAVAHDFFMQNWRTLAWRGAQWALRSYSPKYIMDDNCDSNNLVMDTITFIGDFGSYIFYKYSL